MLVHRGLGGGTSTQLEHIAGREVAGGDAGERTGGQILEGFTCSTKSVTFILQALKRPEGF